ncbi:hypothetical protein PMIN01_05920 [Paraphaeosphaeria minitans]|uniref:Uncharacterized protein n=1 Tax=Paraphaeosphaeria minitans TaxID=565426 RepID=A0A9P6GJA2_9PLEO|nr:hypothetical protein PMIN01_05920 [Paraphaeosphaeria minitans]
MTIGGLAIAICPSPPRTMRHRICESPCTTPPTVVSQPPARFDMHPLRQCYARTSPLPTLRMHPIRLHAWSKLLVKDAGIHCVDLTALLNRSLPITVVGERLSHEPSLRRRRRRRLASK